jgi:hypothetical protein
MPRLERMTTPGLLRTAVAAAAIAAVGAGLAVRHAAGGPRDGGVSAGLAAMERLPAERSLPADVARWVESSAAATNTDEEGAKRRVRKLRSDLGAAHSDIYAYRAAGGGTCFELTTQVALCPKDAQAGPRGIQWVTGGGFGSVPRDVAALVSDEVVAVELSAGSVARPVAIRNNTIFAELPAGPAQLRLTFRDGTTEAIALPDER